MNVQLSQLSQRVNLVGRLSVPLGKNDSNGIQTSENILKVSVKEISFAETEYEEVNNV